MSTPDFTPFYLAVVDFLGKKKGKGGQAMVADLGGDPSVKAAFTALSLSKKTKMLQILEMRPDLFEKCMTESNHPAMKLTPEGFQASESQQIPAISAAAQAAVQAKKVPQSVSQNTGMLNPGFDLPDLPAGVMANPTEGRRYFITCVLRCLAAQPELKATPSQLGQNEAMKNAFALTGLSQSYKMLEIIKERPDLLMVTSDAMKQNPCVHLTNLGMAYAPGFTVPDPDRSCPAPSQPKKLLYAGGGKGRGKGGGKQYGMPGASAYSPY